MSEQKTFRGRGKQGTYSKASEFLQRSNVAHPIWMMSYLDLPSIFALSILGLHGAILDCETGAVARNPFCGEVWSTVVSVP